MIPYGLLWKYSLRELWLQHAEFSLMQCIFIGLFFVVCDIVICMAIAYMQLGSILEVGYPKRTKKQRRQWSWAALKGHSFLNKLFLWRLCKEAPRKHFYLWLAFILNGINVFVFAAVPIAYMAMILTRGAGWTCVLLIFLPITYLGFVGMVTFIPSLLWLPSERRRYRRK